MADKYTWSVTIANRPSVIRATQKSARAQVESMVEHQIETKLIQMQDDVALALVKYRCQRRWKKDGLRHQLFLDETLLATMDLT